MIQEVCVSEPDGDNVIEETNDSCLKSDGFINGTEKYFDSGLVNFKKATTASTMKNPVAVTMVTRGILFGVVALLACFTEVTSAHGDGLDIPDVMAYAGKVFSLSFQKHPVYGSLHVTIEVSAVCDESNCVLPTWLSFNSSSKTLSGVPLSKDRGQVLLKVKGNCETTIDLTKEGQASDMQQCQNSSGVFQLTVSELPWANVLSPQLSSAGPVLTFTSETSPPRVADNSPYTAGDHGCEGDRVIASLVLCASVDELDSDDRINLLNQMAEFLSVPVLSLTLEPSVTQGLKAVEKGFQIVSAGPGSDDSCHLTRNIEVLWSLPCSTVKHLTDFVRVLQHNVDGGRLQEELNKGIVGWYVASSNSLVTRQNRRRRNAGHRTIVPTPAVYPVKPTSLTSTSDAVVIEETSSVATSQSRLVQLSSAVDTSASTGTELASHDMSLSPSPHIVPSSPAPTPSALQSVTSSEATASSSSPVPPASAILPTSSSSVSTSSSIVPSRPEIQMSSRTQTLSSEIHVMPSEQTTSSYTRESTQIQPSMDISSPISSKHIHTPSPTPELERSTLIVPSPTILIDDSSVSRTGSLLDSIESIAKSTMASHSSTPIIHVQSQASVVSSATSASDASSGQNILGPDATLHVPPPTLQVHPLPVSSSVPAVLTSTPILSTDPTYLVTSRVVQIVTALHPSVQPSLASGTATESSVPDSKAAATPAIAPNISSALQSSTVTLLDTAETVTVQNGIQTVAYPTSPGIHQSSLHGLIPSSVHDHSPNTSASFNQAPTTPSPDTFHTDTSPKVMASPTASGPSAIDSAMSSHPVVPSRDQTDSVVILSPVEPASSVPQHLPSAVVEVPTMHSGVSPSKALSPSSLSRDIASSAVVIPVHEDTDTETSGASVSPPTSTSIEPLAEPDTPSAEPTLATVADATTTTSIPTQSTTTTTTTSATTTTTTTTTTTRRTTTRRPTTSWETTYVPWTPSWPTDWETDGEDSNEDSEEPENNRPFVQNSINLILGEQGRLLEFYIPHDVFFDIEDGDTRALSLSLELPSSQELPSNFWLYLEPGEQVLKGLPLHEDMDIKNVSVVLVARDSRGLAARDSIALQINDAPRRYFTHTFTMRFATDFQQFMRNRRNITGLLDRIGSYFGDNGAKFITVVEVRQGSFVLSWTNNTLTGSVCQKSVVKYLLGRMVRRDGTVRSSFNRHVGRHLQLMEVLFEPRGSCFVPTTTTTTTVSTTTKLMSDRMDNGLSIWAHVILPVMIAILVFVLIILIIIFCNRRRMQRQASLNAEKEAISNDRNPIIFPDEIEGDDPALKAREPLVLPSDPNPSNQNVSSEQSQPRNNLNREEDRSRHNRDNREQDMLIQENQIQEPLPEQKPQKRSHRHGKDGKKHKDRNSGVSASSTLSFDRPNNHYLEEEAGSRSSTLNSTKSTGSDKRHKNPPPYWQSSSDPPPYRLPPPYLTNNTTQV